MKNRDFADSFDDFFDENKILFDGDENFIHSIKFKLKNYIKYVLEWGKVHNIVSAKFTDEDVFDAIIDSVIGSSFISANSDVFDVGSGGGFPGIPMAIIHANNRLILVEADRKKCSFLRLVKSELNLTNIQILNSRIETLSNLPSIVSKAAFSPKNMSYLSNALTQGGTMALWATPMTAKEYLEESKKHNLILEGQFPYELSKEKKRMIMIFRKT